MRYATLMAALVLVGGCAAMSPAPVAEIAALPVVRVGTAPPAGAYVLFFPAGHPFPARLNARGSLFQKEETVTTQVALSRDIYLYKHWASHDGKLWRNSHDLLRVAFSGGFDIAGAQATVNLDAR